MLFKKTIYRAKLYTTELAKVFERKPSAIRSRIRKLVETRTIIRA